MENKIKRKDFLKTAFVLGITIAGFGTFAISCGDDKSKREVPDSGKEKSEFSKKDPCSNINDLSQQEKQVREAYQYTGSSTIAGQNCANCNYFQIPNPGESCGTCQVVKGPINPKGHCIIWTKKIA